MSIERIIRNLILRIMSEEYSSDDLYIQGSVFIPLLCLHSVRFLVFWDRTHKRNWKIVCLGQISLVQHNLLLSLSALKSERTNYPRLSFCSKMRPSLCPGLTKSVTRLAPLYHHLV